jgi:hypothetical protein
MMRDIVDPFLRAKKPLTALVGAFFLHRRQGEQAFSNLRVLLPEVQTTSPCR